MDKDKLIEEMLKDMGDKNNTIDLNAYGRGLIDMYNRLVKNCSIPAVSGTLPDTDFVCDKCKAWGCNALMGLFEHREQCISGNDR